MTTEVKDDKGLTLKMRLFVEAYFTTNYNATEAARIAGYKDGPHIAKQAYQLMNTPAVKAAIDKRAEDRIKEVNVSVDYVLRKLIRTVEKADSQENYNATLRGLELMARHLGMLTDKTEITGKDGAAIKYEEVHNDAADFVSTIAGLASRGTEDEGPLRVIPGGKSPA